MPFEGKETLSLSGCPSKTRSYESRIRDALGTTSGSRGNLGSTPFLRNPFFAPKKPLVFKGFTVYSVFPSKTRYVLREGSYTWIRVNRSLEAGQDPRCYRQEGKRLSQEGKRLSIIILPLKNIGGNNCSSWITPPPFGKNMGQ
jgi:hypothetical protein